MGVSDFKKDLMEDVRQIQEEMDLLLNQLANWRKAPAANRLWRPYTDVWETDSEVVVTVELAGVKPADVSLTLNNGILTVRGERRPLPMGDGACFRNMEISMGRFERLLHLPDTIDPEKIKAAYKEGLLEIRIAKSPSRKSDAREIEITGE